MTEKTISQMLDEFNKLGNEKLIQQFGATFRPRASFKDKADAMKSLAKLAETISAHEKGYAAQEAQPKTVEVASAEEKKEDDEMVTNGRKKTVRKAAKVAKVKSKVATRGGRKSQFVDTQKIVMQVKDNPRREGTDVHKQFEIAKKAGTIGAYLKAGGRLGTLQKGIKKQWLKVV
jgi:hypothetical protein